jgi:hypothetical protein
MSAGARLRGLGAFRAAGGLRAVFPRFAIYALRRGKVEITENIAPKLPNPGGAG